MTRYGLLSVEDTKLVLAVAKKLRSAGYSSVSTQQTLAKPPAIHFRNDSGEEVPAFACMQITGTVEAGGQNYFTIDKPVDARGIAGSYLFNSIAPVEIDGRGMAFAGPDVRALTDGTTIACGDRWSPEVGAWNLIPGGSLLIAAGEDDIETDILRGFMLGTDNNVAVAYLTSSVTARSGSTMGSGSAKLQQPTGASLANYQENATDVTLTVYNTTTKTLSTDQYVQIKREFLGNNWLVDVASCS